MKQLPFLKATFLVFLPFMAFSQPAIDWSLNYGDTQAEYATDLVASSNSIFTFLFNRLSPNGDSEFCLTKVEENGNEIWTKCFGGSFHSYGNGLAQTADEGFVICGKSNSPDFLDQDYRAGTDGFIMKLNSNGVLEWKIGLGGGQFDVLSDIKLSPNGDLIAAGYSFSKDGNIANNMGLADVWVVSVSQNGQLNWSKNYGGISSDQASALTLDGNNIIVAGHTNSANEFRKGGDDWYVLKLDGNGHQLWAKSYGGDKHERAKEIITLNEGGYTVGGYTESFGGDVSNNNGKRDGWLLKLTVGGDIEWGKVIGGTENDQLSAVIQDFEGQIVVSGYGDSSDGDLSNAKGRSDSFLAVFDLQGNREWIQNYGGQKNDQAHTLTEGAGASLLLAGYTNSTDGDLNNNKGEEDAWVLKLEGTNQLILALDEDKTICAGDTIQLKPNVINCSNCTYSWSDGSTAINRTLTPSQSKNIILTVSNGDGQIAKDSVFVKVNPLPQISAEVMNITCFGLNDGSVFLTQQDNYQYLWDNGSVSKEIADLAPGSIGVKVNTTLGCQIIESFQITEPEDLILSLSAKDTICFEELTNLSVTANGGVGNYSYLWNNGIQSNNNNNAFAGEYSVTVFDGNGCNNTIQTTVASYDSLALNASINQPLCVDSMKGSIEIDLKGGAGNYSYQWENNATSNALFDLGPGTYLLTATDGACGEISQTFLLESAPSLELNMNETFVGDDRDSLGTGKVLLSVEGGVPPYKYSWNTGEFTDSLVNLSEGTYVVTITDESDCSLVSSFSIGNTTSLNNINAIPYFNVFPNPNNGNLSVQIKLEKVAHLQLQLYNSVGHLLEKHSYFVQELNDFFDLSHLPKGLYIMRIKIADGVATQKFLIQ